VDFKPKVCYTVKLSRYLYPKQKRHNLDTLIEAHGLEVTQRHRAMGDAHLLYQFWILCQEKFGQEKLNEAVADQLGHASLPPHIDSAMVDDIPDSPGVYLFYADNDLPLYIGKSKHLRKRVLSHFQSALGHRKEMKLSLQVKRIEWIETAGELGALLLESRLIKTQLPQMNIKLRRTKELCAWTLHEDRQGFLRPELITAKDMQAGQQTHLYGLFSSKRAATTAMASIAKKSLLCEGLLGLEKLSPGAPCFGFQVKVCAGACVGKESPLKHNLKLTTALTRLRISLWPYKGPVGIKEGEEIHVVDQWCYLGSAKDDAQLDDILQQGRGEFEMDTYQLLKKSMAHLSSDALVQLTRRPVEKETLDTFA
jgi:DNA polymerase-3 subunit epsilon